MARVFYLCGILGDGTARNAFRPAAAAHPCEWRALFDGRTANGHPKHLYTLVLVEAIDHAPLEADTQCNALPIDFDALYAGLSNQVKNRINTVLDKFSIDKTFLANVTTFGDVILHLARQIDENMTRAQLGV